MSNILYCRGGLTPNNYLNQVIEKLVRKLVSDFKPDAIIADGSLGKAEITIREIKGEFLLESDFDLQVVSSDTIGRVKMLSYSEKISEKFGFEINVRRTDPRIFSSASEDDLALSYKNPSISTYERKYCSKTLYGKDFIKLIPEINSSKIPVWEGIRLLMNRIGEYLGNSKSIFIKNKIHDNLDEDYRKYSYTKNKCVIACMDSILIANNKYHWSLEKRLEIFNDLLSNDKYSLPNSIHKSREFFSRSVEFKCGLEYPDNLIGNKSMIKLVEESLSYIIERDLKIKIVDWSEFPRIWVKSSKVKSKYFRGPTASILYQNSIVLAKMVLLRKFIPSWRLLTIPHVFWAHLMYGTLPLLLLSTEPKKENLRYLRRVRTNFSKIASLKKPKKNLWKEWDYLSSVGNKIWYTLALV